jgi:hypothetical protein
MSSAVESRCDRQTLADDVRLADPTANITFQT